MDKLKTQILLISLILVLLFSAQAVAAATDGDGNMTSESIDLSICDNTGDVSLNNLSNNPDNILTASNELNVLGADEATYSQLNDEITNGGNTVELQNHYYIYDGSTSTILITGDNRVIDGRGAVIDMAGSTIRAFNVDGSGVTIKNLTIKNANFNGNGGAIYFRNSGTVENCNFVDNKATGYSRGGAVYFNREGTVTNCNFTNNSVTNGYGGAVYFSGNGELGNCNFTNNTAWGSGGAIYFDSSGSVINCNFTNNSARYGGAIYMGSGNVTNCNFTDNKATGSNSWGGAILMGSGSVINCNFTDNSASVWGGAIFFSAEGTVTNCNFTGNNATTGSAIYFYYDRATKTVSNSRFLNNRANAEALEVTKYDNNITIVFTGNDNLLNAIYSNGDVSFANVTYWSANGIANTDSSASTPSRSNKEAGQNITVGVVVDDVLVLSGVYLTDENGKIVLDIIAGENYYITARHDTDSYYTEVVNTTSNNTEFSVNVTSQTTNNKTVNITAKSNIPNEVIKGKLLFILPNGTEITANYGGNGTWWAVHTFDDYGVYEVNASYTGLDNVTINNGTVTINDVRLSVVKSANATEVAYNSTVQFTINITNYGSSNVTGVLVSDLLPEGLTFIEAGVISYDGRYEVVYSPGLLPDLVVPIDGKNHVTYIYGPNDIAQWNITGISGGNSVILLISARANGLVMGNITNEVTVRYQENETDTIVNSTNITVIPANSSVSAEDVEVTYGQSIVVVVSSENATGVSYKVIGKEGIVKEGTVNVGESITGLDLAAGDYTVNLTTIVDSNYTSSNYTSKITVKPANSTVKAEDVEVTYGDPIVVTITSENATKVSYQVIGADGVVKEGIVNVGESITGLDLAAGDYTVNLTTIVDANYTSSNYTSKITVKPANSTVKAEDVEVTYGDPIVVTITSENATGVSYKVIGKEGIVKEGTVNVGESITGLDLAAGDYTVNLTTIVDSNYTSSNFTSKITVKPANSTVKAEDVEVTYGDPIVVTITSENATGVSYKVIGADGIVKEGTVNVGESITGLDLGAGDYTVNLTTIVDANYTSSNFTSKITVKPANSSVSAGDVEVVYGDSIVVVVSSENATGVSYKVIGKEGIVKEGTVNVGESITGLDLGAGDYTVNLTTIVDANYTSSNFTSKITVKSANSTVKAEDVEVTYGDSIVVVVSSENATGVSYKVIGADGVVKEGAVNVGENITGLDLAAGDYTVNLTTIVNANYTSSNYTSKITVKPANSTVKAEDVEVTYGDPIVVTITSENATKVSYQVIGADGVVKEGIVNVGESITGLDLAAGDYTVNLTTIVDANYTSSNFTSKITVKPANSSVSAGDVEVTYGEAIVIPVSVVNAVALYYDVVDKNNNIVVSDIIPPGSNITVSDLAAGSYNVTLITDVDLNHTSVRNSSKIIVKRAGSSVSAEDVTVNYGEAISIPVSSANATEISYTITDANTKAVANGTVKPDSPISVSDLAAGDYTVSLATVVDANHTSVSNSSQLHIRHVVTITIAPVTGHAGEVVNFTAQFNYENGSMVNEGTASLTIKYEERKVLSASMYSVLSADESVPVSNGKATFTVKLGEPGRYLYVVSYSGSDVDDGQVESTLTILKANTNVSCSNISGKPADKKNVTVTVLDQDNNPVANGTVTLTLNGKTYNSTVENGKAVLSIELPNPGRYNATVTYNGNDYYNSSTSSIVVDVEKVNTDAPSAEDVSGNAGEKTDISVKFVDENGNPVKNGTATLTIDGKTYTAEVINGTATFKDVVIPENDTVADVYYQGNDYYNASSATFSIKVKHNNTEPDTNNTDENKVLKHELSDVVDGNATGNPIAVMLLALFVMVITYRKK